MPTGGFLVLFFFFTILYIYLLLPPPRFPSPGFVKTRLIFSFSSSFPGALAVVATGDNRGNTPLFTEFDERLGFYKLRLYQDGFPRDIVIDDAIPCLGGGQPAYALGSIDQAWLPLGTEKKRRKIDEYLDHHDFLASFPLQPFPRLLLLTLNFLIYYSPIVLPL